MSSARMIGWRRHTAHCPRACASAPTSARPAPIPCRVADRVMQGLVGRLSGCAAGDVRIRPAGRTCRRPGGVGRRGGIDRPCDHGHHVPSPACGPRVPGKSRHRSRRAGSTRERDPLQGRGVTYPLAIRIEVDETATAPSPAEARLGVGAEAQPRRLGWTGRRRGAVQLDGFAMSSESSTSIP